jgi:hypothetical protein
MGYGRRGLVSLSGARKVRRGVLACVLSLAVVSLTTVLSAVSHPLAAQQTPACAKTDFEAVVDEAAEALRDLNQKHKPEFQERLRGLKDKRGWDHDQFMKEAAPFVKDDKITSYETRSFQLLEEISTLGQDGATAATPDCALLIELQARMKLLVDIQTEKWTYMFAKIDGEMAK